MDGGWLDPSTLVAAWSAVAATVACVIAWLVYGQQQEADKPIVTCELVSPKNNDEVVHFHLHIRNVGDTRWSADKIEIVRPSSGLAFRPRSRASGEDEAEWKAAQVAGASSTVLLNIDLEPYGTAVFQRPADSKRATVYLLRSSIPSNKVSMRLTLLSKDAVQRRKVIAIKRTLPPPSTAAIV